ncbi:Uncharacterised protein [uncultured archaeon]|nr:Uncharacterised protein [uncultured archaeon]
MSFVPIIPNKIEPVKNSERIGKIVVAGASAHLFDKVCYGLNRPRPDIEVSELRLPAGLTPGNGVSPAVRNALGDTGTGMAVLIFENGLGPEKTGRLAEDVKLAGGKKAFTILMREEKASAQYDGPEPPVPAPQFIDQVFSFRGSEALFIAMVGLLEDRLNFQNDLESVVLVVDDKPKHYSRFLTEFYEINRQRTRVRLACDYEEAQRVILDCAQGENLAGVISDLWFPRNGRHDQSAFALLEFLRKSGQIPITLRKVPAIVMSADKQALDALHEQVPDVFCFDKNDPLLLQHVRQTVNDFFGFGAFRIFVPGSGEPFIVEDLHELKVMLKAMPDSVLLHYSRHNYFSGWLRLHGHKELAAAIRPIDSEDAGEVRALLLEKFGQYEMGLLASGKVRLAWDS